MRRKEIWRNVYTTRDGAQTLGQPMGSRDEAKAVSHLMGSTRTIGRWKITLKEAPRDGR